MWIIFEGLDKTGKTTLMYELCKKTKYKNILIDRGPAGYLTFDEIFNRTTNKRKNNYNYQSMQCKCARNIYIIYCFCDKEIADIRLKNHNEVCNYDYKNAQKIYDRYINECYNEEQVFYLNTSKKSISTCVNLIIKNIKEFEKNEIK